MLSCKMRSLQDFTQLGLQLTKEQDGVYLMQQMELEAKLSLFGVITPLVVRTENFQVEYEISEEFLIMTVCLGSIIH